jgi:hypothetical protein
MAYVLVVSNGAVLSLGLAIPHYLEKTLLCKLFHLQESRIFLVIWWEWELL